MNYKNEIYRNVERTPKVHDKEQSKKLDGGKKQNLSSQNKNILQNIEKLSVSTF